MSVRPRFLVVSLIAATLPLSIPTSTVSASTPFGLADTATGSSFRFKPSSDPAYWAPTNSTEVLAFPVSRAHVANMLGHELHAAGYKWGANNVTHIFFKCDVAAEQAVTSWPNCPSGGKVYTVQMWGGYGASYAYLQDLFS